MNEEDRKNYLEGVRTVVLKVGTQVVSSKGAVRILVEEINFLKSKRINVVLVSSGAIGMGREKLSLPPQKILKLSLPEKQALAAVGQVELMKKYEREMRKYNLIPAQILLTHSIFSNRKTYLNARNTFDSIFNMGFIPIVNENDTVATDEITFGDNDILSAMVSVLVEANLMVLLTDTEGLYKNYSDPSRRQLLSFVKEITPEIKREAKKEGSLISRGGMISKIRAAEIAVKSGIPVVIARFREGVVKDILEAKSVGTFFAPSPKVLSSRKKWIAFHSKPKGCIVVDDGAVDAIRNKGKSLLPKGIVDVKGKFQMGDVVKLVDINNRTVALGITNYSSSDVRKIMGHHTSEIDAILETAPYRVVVHRNNMAVV